jgi:hypothetical protein
MKYDEKRMADIYRPPPKRLSLDYDTQVRLETTILLFYLNPTKPLSVLDQVNPRALRGNLSSAPLVSIRIPFLTFNHP